MGAAGGCACGERSCALVAHTISSKSRAAAVAERPLRGPDALFSQDGSQCSAGLHGILINAVQGNGMELDAAHGGGDHLGIALGVQREDDGLIHHDLLGVVQGAPAALGIGAQITGGALGDDGVVVRVGPEAVELAVTHIPR